MQKGFTLIELLVVIAIVAVLAVTVLLTLNPAELLKQARDSNRLSDLTSLNTALAAYQASGGTSMGTASVVYVSLPDSSSTCGSWSLPSLPAGWTYSCKATSTYQAADGTGWLPVNLAATDAGTPLSKLPIDPTNSSSTGLYYTYGSSGTGGFEVAASLEAAKNTRLSGTDGGSDPVRVERGSNLAVTPPYGMALWLDASQITSLTDGQGVSQWNDLSGNGRNVTNASTTQQPLYKTGIVNGLPVVRFDGVNDQLAIPSITYGTAIALSRRTGSMQAILSRGSGTYRGFTLLGDTVTYNIFDQYWVNGLSTTTSSAGNNSNAVISGLVVTNPYSAGSGLLGYGNPSQQPLNGDIGELMVWSTQLNTLDRRKAESYFGQKWGISIQ